MKIISLFSGAGGLDLGFHQAGFNTIWANEFDSSIWETFEYNFPHVHLDRRSITDILPTDIPECAGIIGGPPCQSWSEAGARRGINDKRGQLFFEYIRILKEKSPLFFLAENVSGILLSRHQEAFQAILREFNSLNYNVSYFLLNAHDYDVPQDRKRVIIVGYHKKIGKSFTPPSKVLPKPTLKDAIWDLRLTMPAKEKKGAYEGENFPILNHEYVNGGFSSIYMSRNRVRSWDEPSFTIQASGRHAPLHPQAPKMALVERDKRVFVQGKEDLYRRLSVRECARIQTFPDDFIFKYKNISDGYKMVGNAVPVKFAKHLASVIFRDILE
ncbi:DNA-methyltransferase Dcm [Beggiatoa alba B18LD]|uniref:DNA (cytosine-5-)-methyltransferase n=1 Tax=Beggiatoa alba B18LD TaxID=395493 RepID=I3CCM6_9GAMM|nr:DNA cytosine methyltransferase [Beggiatoa alba]EIJ41369.1 DNA-methyltransferase Dcm [Beggiatoa alba B18LD]